MWILSNRGFYSAVQHRDMPDHLMVRARVRSDLEALEDLLPGVEILETPEGDYPVRIVVPRQDWERAVQALTQGITYDDFKSTVAALQGVERHDVYEQVWDVLHDLEPSEGGTMDASNEGELIAETAQQLREHLQQARAVQSRQQEMRPETVKFDSKGITDDDLALLEADDRLNIEMEQVEDAAIGACQRLYRAQGPDAAMEAVEQDTEVSGWVIECFVRRGLDELTERWPEGGGE